MNIMPLDGTPTFVSYNFRQPIIPKWWTC